MELKRPIQLIKEARFVFIVGNGGSSATAEHLSNDLFSKGIKAICLSSNSSIMTMIGNDFGYELTFSRQLEVYGTSEDLLIAISCSGTSPNVVNALDTALKIGMPTIQFETFDKDRDYDVFIIGQSNSADEGDKTILENN